MIEFRKTAGVLLAAGASYRYGSEDKLLAPFGGEPLVLHAARALLAVPLGRHIAAVRHSSSQVADELARAGFEIVHNAEAHLGLSTSLAVAACASAGQDGMLVCLADMPQVQVGHLEALIAAVGREGIAASSTGCDGPRSPPAVFAARHFDKLKHLAGDVGARALLQIAEIVTAPSSELIDLERWMMDRRFRDNVSCRRNVGRQRRARRNAFRCL